MVRNVSYFSLFILVFYLLSIPLYSQQKWSEPIKNTTAFVTDFRAPYDRLIVDIDQNNFVETEYLVLPVSAATKIVNKKDKPIDRQMIRPGMEIEISGDRYADKIEISMIKVKTDLEKWEVEAKGYFEALDGDKAWIDGKQVRLAPGAMIIGKEHWQGKTYTTLGELQAGAALKLEGVRRSDGVIYAIKGDARPNEFTKGDLRMLQIVKAGTIMPAKLEGGKGMVAGREVKFVNDIDLQTYVTKIGNRLVPRYERDLPDDYPGKRVYRFAVIEDDSFNAFSLPDGSVFVNTGLLKQIKSEAQLATILGHEIAHVTYEHGRKQLEGAEKRQWLALLAAAGGAAAGSREVAAAGIIAVKTLQNKFGRNDEDQADRVGLYYMRQAGYDPREAPKVWREISKNTRQDAISTFLYSDHSSARARLKNLDREIAYSYYDTDFSHAKVGTDEYMKNVGPYFGWIPKPAPKPVVTLPAPVKNGGALGKKPIAPAAQNPTASIIAFAVRQLNQDGAHSRGDVYADLTLENFRYIVSLKTGRTVRKTPVRMKSFSADYADVSFNTMNAAMKDTGQGGGWLLKKNGNDWQIVALAEGDWQCANLTSVPENVRRELKLACF